LPPKASRWPGARGPAMPRNCTATTVGVSVVLGAGPLDRAFTNRRSAAPRPPHRPLADGLWQSEQRFITVPSLQKNRACYTTRNTHSSRVARRGKTGRQEARCGATGQAGSWTYSLLIGGGGEARGAVDLGASEIGRNARETHGGGGSRSALLGGGLLGGRSSGFGGRSLLSRDSRMA
jgi:hypothetical protein